MCRVLAKIVRRRFGVSEFPEQCVDGADSETYRARFDTCALAVIRRQITCKVKYKSPLFMGFMLIQCDDSFGTRPKKMRISQRLFIRF